MRELSSFARKMQKDNIPLLHGLVAFLGGQGGKGGNYLKHLVTQASVKWEMSKPMTIFVFSVVFFPGSMTETESRSFKHPTTVKYSSMLCRYSPVGITPTVAFGP